MNSRLPIPPPEQWKHDPAALRAFLAEHELTGSAAAALVDVNARTIRKWVGGEREMPYSAWFCLVMRGSLKDKKP